MLSESLRIMRREFQHAVLEAGECVQISVAHMQAFIIALEQYEAASKEMEDALWPQPMAIPQPNTGQRIPHISRHKIPKLTIIHGGASSDQ